MFRKKMLSVIPAVMVLLCLLSACAAAPAMEVSYAQSPTSTPIQTSEPEQLKPTVTASPVPPPTPTISPSSPPTATPSTLPSQTETNYEAYLGNWICSDTAKTRSEVFDQGGSAIQFTEITGKHAIGNVISVSESYGHRDASVDFDGYIVDGGVLTIQFDNDGWDNYGTITIVFQKDSLFASMQSYETNQYANWNIGFGDYQFIRES